MPETDELNKLKKFNNFKDKIIRYLNVFFSVLDQLFLVLVAFGLLIVGGKQLYDAIFEDVLEMHQHPVSHQISELLIVLVIMELFRQVLNQFNRKPFSLNPFLFIGFIVTVRGMIVTEMKMSAPESGQLIGWQEGILLLVGHALVVLILVFSYHIYAKTGNLYGKKENDNQGNSKNIN
ncbi:MAG: phosphate-starvation-inducible PsiE family protein [Spirochaetota bacterium]|nr:phosphate-starvation-inducible PsiE family protein [Spirochaetota bacterium]